MSYSSKVITSIIILLALIIGAGFLMTVTLSNSAKKLDSYITEIESNTKSGNWQKAEENLKDIEKDWSKTKGVWAVMMDHIEIDNIETTLTKVAAYVESKEVPLALAEISTLKQYVKHIPQKESFNIENIF